MIKEKKLLNENSKVLDIGCGTGRHLLEFLKGKEWKNYVKGIYYKGNYSLGCKCILK